jgi:hypothetical protein
MAVPPGKEDMAQIVVEMPESNSTSQTHHCMLILYRCETMRVKHLSVHGTPFNQPWFHLNFFVMRSSLAGNKRVVRRS